MFLRCSTIFAVLFGFALSASAALPVSHFATQREGPLRGGPELDPLRFFAGRTHNWGVFEGRSGEPTRRFSVEGRGQPKGGELLLDQQFRYEDGHTETRHWRIKRTSAHGIEATASDVVGKARGEAYGNAFRWAYLVDLKPGHPFSLKVRVRQWLYLQEDGRSMFQHAVISKYGVTVAQVTEWIRKD